jgi:hypothetical protein
MDQANAVRESEQLNWEYLEAYLKNALPDLTGKMEVAQFHGGHANLTYLLKFGDQERVLRRPPFGKIAFHNYTSIFLLLHKPTGSAKMRKSSAPLLSSWNAVMV